MKIASVPLRGTAGREVFPPLFQFLDPPRGRPIGAAVIIVPHGEWVSTFGITAECYDVPRRYLQNPDFQSGFHPRRFGFPQKSDTTIPGTTTPEQVLRHHRSVSTGTVGGGDLELSQGLPDLVRELHTNKPAVTRLLRAPSATGYHLPDLI